jgi:hypothetical protein
MDPLMIVNFVCVCLLAAAALHWGATPERICAATLFTVTFADPAYHILVGHGAIYRSVDIGHLVMDLAVAAVFVAVALRANRVYPLWLAAFQLVSVLSHFAREVTEFFPMRAYGFMSFGPYYFILLILAGGITLHARRIRRLGLYRSWRRSSSPSPGVIPRSQPTG